MKHLVAEIAALQQRGYTIEQVVESLQGVGLTITTPTLKSYLQRAKAKPVKTHSGGHPRRLDGATRWEPTEATGVAQRGPAEGRSRR